MNIGERLKYLRTELLDEKYTMKSFGEQLGVSGDVIKNIEYNRVEAKEHMIKLICQTFNVNEEWLINGKGDIFKEGNKENDLVEELKNKYQLNDTYTSLIKSLIALDEETQNKVVGLFFKCVEDYYKNNPSALDKLNEKCNTDANTKIIPISEEDDELSITEDLDNVRLYDLPVSAGTGTYLLDDVSYEVITIDRRHYKDVDFALRVSGDSMEPKYSNNDIIYVKSTLQVNNGEIGVFYYNDEAYLKKLEHKNGKIFLISLNEKYKPIEITNDSFKVVGIVL